MRGGSGEDLARTLTRRYPDFPVIFMPAYLARYRTAYLTGPILEKPFRANELCELIGSVLTAAPGLRSRGFASRPLALMSADFQALSPAGRWPALADAGGDCHRERHQVRRRGHSSGFEGPAV